MRDYRFRLTLAVKQGYVPCFTRRIARPRLAEPVSVSHGFAKRRFAT